MAFEPIDFVWLLKRQALIDKGEADALPIEFFENLTVAWEELSFAYGGLDPAGRLMPALENPGYLTTDCDDWQVFVPWPLVTLFPGPQALSDLLRVGTTVVIQPATNFCISGSSAWMGGEIIVGDLDFCQYVPLPPASIASEAE